MNTTFQFGVSFRLEDLYPNCMYLMVPTLGYVFPVFAVLATAVNILAAVVFLQPHVRSHTTYILTLIACTDTLNIVVPTGTYVHYYSLGHYKEYFSYRLCFLSYFLADVCVDFFNALSLWLTVLLAYIRCRCLKSPFNAHKIHTSKKIALYVACILIFTVISHLPSLFLFDFTPVSRVDRATNETKEVCVITESNFVFPNTSMGRKVQVCTTTVLDSVLPCIILVYQDFIILLTLRQAKLSRRSLRRDSPTQANTSDVTAETRRQTQNNLKLGGNCFRALIKFQSFGNAADNHSCENSAEKNGTVASDMNANSRTPRKKLLSYFVCSKKSCLNVNHKPLKRKTTASTESAFDKLDKESRRTSWLILAVATIISLHEIPLAVANVYALIKHAGVSLPLNIYGCLSVILLLWQYITYLVIFLIYAFMSGAFRTELKRIITTTCKKNNTVLEGQNKVFMSPCSVRKALSRDEDVTAGPSQDTDF